MLFYEDLVEILEKGHSVILSGDGMRIEKGFIRGFKPATSEYCLRLLYMRQDCRFSE
jgi:hypothetical protein